MTQGVNVSRIRLEGRQGPPYNGPVPNGLGSLNSLDLALALELALDRKMRVTWRASSGRLDAERQTLRFLPSGAGTES